MHQLTNSISNQLPSLQFVPMPKKYMVQIRKQNQQQPIIPYALMDVNANSSSLIHNSMIPQKQLLKFATTLQFLKQNQLQDYLEERFIDRIKKEARLSQLQLRNLFQVLKIQKLLLTTMKTYFYIAFKHQGPHYNRRKTPQFNQFQDPQAQNSRQPSKKQSLQEINTKELHDRLMTLSSYQNLSLKIMIESLLFLKNIFHLQFFHKKLINQFEKTEFIKKFEVWNHQAQKKRGRSLLKRNKDTIYFKSEKSSFQNDQRQSEQPKKERTQNAFSVVKSKILTIAFLQYQKLQSRETLFHSHLKLLQKCISERQLILSYFMQRVQKWNQDEPNEILEHQNTTFYLILKCFELRIQFEPKDHEYLILKDLKEKKNFCKSWKQSLENIVVSLEVENNPLLHQILDSTKVYLKNLQSLNDQIIKRVAKELIGPQEQILRTNSLPKSKGNKTPSNTKTNYQRIKQTIYQLTLSCLNEGGNKTVSRNVSNERILQQFMKNHDEFKFKNESEIKFPNDRLDSRQVQGDMNRKLSKEQLQKTRSLTILRQNLHKDIFPQQATSKSKFTHSINRRTRSVFNISRKNKNDQLSIKNLLESPLNRQIQIYLSYQKFMNNSNQTPSKESSNPIRQHTQSRLIDKNAKPINQGLKLIDQINKFTHQQKKNKKLLTSQKKKKIQTIYKAFAYNNKIVDISHWKLQEQINESKKTFFFNKKQVKAELTDPIRNFGSGRKNLDMALQKMLAQRCYMMIHYVKVWHAKPCIYKVRMSQQTKKFILYMKMNNFSINMVLPRGQNILCQRFQTIWPTIRYLLQKKIFQFSLIKFFENLFHQKKISQLKTNNQHHTSTPNPNENSNLIDQGIQRKESATPKNQEFEQNDCTFFQGAFGSIQSDEAQEINSCLDCIHKFLGLVFGETKRQNGRKQMVYALKDNQHKQEGEQMKDKWEKEKQDLFKLYKKQARKGEEWKRVAKCWVTMESQEQVHLMSFLSKNHEGTFYFISLSIGRFELSKVMGIYMNHARNFKSMSEQNLQAIRNRYWDQQLKVKITWRKNQQNYSTHQALPFSFMNISFQRLYLYRLGLNQIHDCLLKITTDGFYHKKLLYHLRTLIANSLFISTSVEGQKLYDLGSTHHKIKKNHLINRIRPFKDHYRLNQTLTNRNGNIKQVRYYKKHLHNDSNQKLNESQQQKSDELKVPLVHLGSNKTQIQVIQNYMNILAWHNSQNQISFKPNSKWKVVQKKIHTMITFVTHLSKKTQRKSSLLATQKIRQNHQFIEQEVPFGKKKQKVSPLMMKSLSNMKKSTINFLQKIQGQLYRVKVNILESAQSMHKQQEMEQKWMGEIILIKESSKQYTKFYISSADIDGLFRPQASLQSQNQSINMSESSQVFHSRKSSPQNRLIKRYNQNKNLRQSLKKTKMQLSQQILEIQSLKLTSNKQDSCFNEYQKHSDKIQDYEQNIQKKNKSLSWEFTKLPSSEVNAREVKDRRVKMFRRIVGLVSFTKIKCFSKIVLSRSSDCFDRTVQRFIAEPRNSLQVLHSATDNPEKIFELKYFNLLQNCYQTMICKPIKIRYNKKTDYVIITLFKIQLKSQQLYQFRINLNKNQTYYACEITDSELKQLIQFSQKEKARRDSREEGDSHAQRLFRGQGLAKNDSRQLQQLRKQQEKSSLANRSCKMLMEDIENGKVFQRKRPALRQFPCRHSNFLNVNEYCPIVSASQQLSQERSDTKSNSNDLIMSIVSKLQEYSKEILENILKKIQVNQEVNSKGDMGKILYLEVPQANFKKQLKLRVLERISNDGASIYLVEINEKIIRCLNEIVIKTSMNKNFDIFKQNIFKNSTLSQSENPLNYNNSQRPNISHSTKLFPATINPSQQQSKIRVRKSQNQNQINLLFSSFNLEHFNEGTYHKIQQMNQDWVIESIEYEVQNKFGKQLVMKFNNKKIKHYAQIFLKYFLKYLQPQRGSDEMVGMMQNNSMEGSWLG